MPNVEEISVHGEEVVFGVVYDPHFSDSAPSSRKDDYVQALYDKMTWISDDLRKAGGKFLIFPGDICNKYAMTTKAMCRLVNFFKHYPIPVYGIAGNHDVYAGNVGVLNRTSLGILFASGVIRRLRHLLVNTQRTTLHIRGFDFEPALHVEAPAREDLISAYEEDHDLVGEEWGGVYPDLHFAVAHGFTRQTQADFKTKDYVNVPSFAKAGYQALFLGHDHVPHPVEPKDGLVLCRGGSLSRGTKHNYQRSRDVQYHLVKVRGTDLDVQERKIPVAPAEDIFCEQQIEREGLSLKLKKFMKKLQDTQGQAGDESDIFSEIEKTDAPQPVKDICYRYLQEGGIVRQGSE